VVFVKSNSNKPPNITQLLQHKSPAYTISWTTYKQILNSNNYPFNSPLSRRTGWARTTTTTTTVLRPFVRDYPGEPVPEETLTHPPSWSSNLYQLFPSITIHSILPVQITCLAIFLHNLSPCPLWSASWSGALHLIFFSQHMSIPSQPLLLSQKQEKNVYLLTRHLCGHCSLSLINFLHSLWSIALLFICQSSRAALSRFLALPLS